MHYFPKADNKTRNTTTDLRIPLDQRLMDHGPSTTDFTG